MRRGIHKTSPVLVAVFVFLRILIASGGDESVYAETPGTCSLSGTVLHVVTREPVGGVTLAVGSIGFLGSDRMPFVVPYGNPSETFETISAEDGTFTITGIEPGNRLLLLRDDTVAAVEGELPFALSPGAEIKGITMLVGEGSSLFGAVYDESYSHGMAGVTIEALASASSGRGWQRAYSAVTKEDGTFWMGGLPMGSYQIRSALDDGFEQRSVVFLKEEPQRYAVDLQWREHFGPVEFTVAPGVRVQGVVVNEAGEPVADAEVMVDWSVWYTPSVYTGSDGSFTVLGWEKPSMPNLRARKGDYFSFATRPGELLGPEITLEDYGPIQLVLRPGARISGRFLDSSGQFPLPPEGVHIDISSDDTAFWREYSTDVAADGTFTFPAVQPGTYSFQTYGGAHEYSSSHIGAVALSFGDSAIIAFDVGQRVGGLAQFLMTSTIQPLSESELPKLDRASGPSYAFEENTEYCQDGFEGLLVELVDPDGYPISNASVGYTKLGDAPTDESDPFNLYDRYRFGDYILAADELGIFCLDSAPDDIYNIEVQSIYPNHRCQINSGPTPLTKVRVVVPRGGIVRGRVTIDGQPVSGARLHYEVDGDSGGGFTTTDDDGFYTCTQIPLHSRTMSCSIDVDVERAQERTFAWGSESEAVVDFTFLPTEAAIAGKFENPSDVSHGTSVEVRMVLPYGEEFGTYARLCDDGSFFVPYLPPGTAYLISGRYSTRKRVDDVYVEQGKTTNMTFPAVTRVSFSGAVARNGMEDEIIVNAYFGTAESLRDGPGWAWPRDHRSLGKATVSNDRFAFENIQSGIVTLLCEKTGKPDGGWIAAPTVLGYKEIDLGVNSIDDIVIDLSESPNASTTPP